MAKDHQAELEEMRVRLVADIQSYVFHCETLKDFNTLAMIFLVKAIDLIAANYDEESVAEVLEFMIHDRKVKRTLPTTKEYSDKVERMKTWIG